MNESKIITIGEKLRDIIKLLDSLNTEVKILEQREARVADLNNAVKRKEVAVKAREADHNKTISSFHVAQDKLASKEAGLKEKQKELDLREQTLEKKKGELEIRLSEIESKLAELSILEERNKELEVKRTQLNNRTKEVIERESLVEKEKQIARERKEQLDIMEAQLVKRQEKLQKLLDNV